MKTTTYNTNTNPSATQNINERKEEKTIKNTIKKTTNWISFYNHDGELCEVVNLKNQYIATERGAYYTGWFGINKTTNTTIFFYSSNQLRPFIDSIYDQAEFCGEDIEKSVHRYISIENESKKAKKEKATPATLENNTTTDTPAEDNGEEKGENNMNTYQKVKDNLFHNYLTMTPGTDPAPEYTEVTLEEKDILKEARHILIEKLSPKDAPLGYNESLILNIKASIAISYNHIFRDDDNLEDYLIIFRWAEQNYPATYLEFLSAFRSEHETEKAEPDDEPSESAEQDTAKYFHANTGNWTPENNDQWNDHYKAQFAHHRITGNEQYIKWLKKHEEKGNNAQWIINTEKEIEKDTQIIKEYVQKYGTFSLYGETADYTPEDF